jgi:transcriptional regulator
MDPAPIKYAPRSPGDVVDLILRHPFAWIVSAHDGFSATPAPLLPDLDADGALIGFKGHFGRGNPHLARLQAQPRCLILFMGEHGYISPSWMTDRTQAPSWNYESATFECELRLLDQPDEPLQHLIELTDVHEAGRPNAWAVGDMGERYHRLSRGVIAFQAAILESRPVFKLGQDERRDVFADIMAGLAHTDQTALVEQMTRQIEPD